MEENILADGQDYAYNDAFGVIRPRWSSELQLSKATKEYPEFVELIVTWVKQKFDVMKTFPFTSFTVNGGVKTKMHRDNNNAGASCIIGLGDYERGRTIYWDQDNKKLSLEELSRIQPEFLDVKDKAVIFDGRRAHATEEFTGTRFTITFFAVRLWERASEEIRNACGGVPWVLPTVRQIENFQKLK